MGCHSVITVTASLILEWLVGLTPVVQKVDSVDKY